MLARSGTKTAESVLLRGLRPCLEGRADKAGKVVPEQHGRGVCLAC